MLDLRLHFVLFVTLDSIALGEATKLLVRRAQCHLLLVLGVQPLALHVQRELFQQLDRYFVPIVLKDISVQATAIKYRALQVFDTCILLSRSNNV